LICFLRKIVNHPRLIYNYVQKNIYDGMSDEESEIDEDYLIAEEARIA
jgi:hypothetical protein